MGTTVTSIRKQLQALANPVDARVLQRFFKTGPGEYGEGDVFLGIKVPPLRTVATAGVDLPTDEVAKLLASKTHEHRAVALMIWVIQFDRGDEAKRGQIYKLYLANTRWINNWDLVDLSATGIVGRWLEKGSRRQLVDLARSESLWERRIAIVATYHFIRKGDFAPTLDIAERLMADKHDLIHKAVGWMLREVYKRDVAVALKFIERHAAQMPRTTLRYAIERCEPAERARLMKIGLPPRPSAK